MRGLRRSSVRTNRRRSTRHHHGADAEAVRSASGQYLFEIPPTRIPALSGLPPFRTQFIVGPGSAPLRSNAVPLLIARFYGTRSPVPGEFECIH